MNRTACGDAGYFQIIIAAPRQGLKGVGKTVRNTFRGGVHPAERKELSRDVRLRLYDPKGEMVFPLQQHIGKPAKPVVQKGDAVLVGQKIAEAEEDAGYGTVVQAAKLIVTATVSITFTAE